MCRNRPSIPNQDIVLHFRSRPKATSVLLIEPIKCDKNWTYRQSPRGFAAKTKAREIPSARYAGCKLLKMGKLQL